MARLGERRMIAPLLGSRIKELRIRLGWTQVELAQQSGVPAPTICKYERNKRKMVGKYTVRKIANALGVSVEELTGVQKKSW